MRTKFLAVMLACVCFAAAPCANAASDTAAVKKTIVDAFARANKGDFPGALGYFAKDGTVIDELAPFHWSSFDAWSSALGSYDSQNGVAKPLTKILKFAHVNIEDGHAYAVASVAYIYKEGGKPRKESGTEVFTLLRDGSAWKIDSFNWLSKAGVDQGTDADAVVAAAKSFAQSASASPAPSTIVDEFAPYHWTGASAQEDWGARLKTLMTKVDQTDLAVNLDPPSHLSVNGNTAYAVFPTTLTSKIHGKPAPEKGAFAMVFEKDGGWHIVSWAWATK